jgi:hypothetical protein
MEDPVRPEAVDAVAAAHEAGIRVLMLTGDHVDTARAIGGSSGLGADGAEAVEGRALEAMDDAELDGVLATPRERLRARGAGAQAARSCSGSRPGRDRGRHRRRRERRAGAARRPPGVAMGKAAPTSPARRRDMVLADDNFATITAAVEEGRVVFSNIRKVTFFLLSTGVGQIAAILVALSVGLAAPVPGGADPVDQPGDERPAGRGARLRAGEPGLLAGRRAPPARGCSRCGWRSGSGGSAPSRGRHAGMFWWTLRDRRRGPRPYGGHDADGGVPVLPRLNCRSLDRSILRVPLLSNRFLFVSLVAAAIAHTAVLYVPFLQSVFRTMPLLVAHGLGDVAVAPGRADALLVALHGQRGEGDHRNRAGGGSPLSSAVASSPSMPGSWMSIRMRSGCSARAIVRPASASVARAPCARPTQQERRQRHVAGVVLDDQDARHQAACFRPDMARRTSSVNWPGRSGLLHDHGDIAVQPARSSR